MKETRWGRFIRGMLHIEHEANIFPLLHVVSYYVIFALLAIPGAVQNGTLQCILWVLLLLLNYSLSIGLAHLHAHRKIFTSRAANRLLEFLLCFPAVSSYPMMLYVHVYLHHKHNNGNSDPTSTRGVERGLSAIKYWLGYSFLCQATTFKALFASAAPRSWQRYRSQYLVDTIGTLSLAFLFLIIDPWRMLWVYELPLILTLLNIGFFSWLTHAPAFGGGHLSNSLNTANNWMNIFVHNQGYHSLHHIAPGIHWTEIPDKFNLMVDVDERLIVRYWVTLDSSWRILRPANFHDRKYGLEWKKKFRLKQQSAKNCRIPWLPYFGWV